MDLKVYERTRYQNIYRHKKNKNYVVQLTSPKTSISKIDGLKIVKLDDALKIRDNPKIALQKKAELTFRGGFDELWDKYTQHCEIELKLSFNTLKKKRILYNLYFKGKLPVVSKITKDYIARFIDELDCTNKQKNELIRIIKPFFNWCVDEEFILVNPIARINKYKTVKKEMKYWLPDDVKKFFDYINLQLEKETDEVLYRTKILVLLGFVLGDRIGETRALRFGNINEYNKTITIDHSINYDISSDDFISSTKTHQSNRTIDVTDKLIEELNNYKYYLVNYLGYNIDNDTLILFNHNTKRPISDSTLRKDFYNVCDKANVPKIRLYDLRHTYTVIALNYDEISMWAVSNRLGHTNLNTTIKTYNHISQKVRKEMANSTDKYF